MTLSISINDLRFSYGSMQVFESLSFGPFHGGEFITVLGPNASGKSTLFKCISGILQPQSGDIRLGKDSVVHSPMRERLKYIGYLPQSYSSRKSITVFESLLMALKVHGQTRVSRQDLKRVEDALTQLQIESLSDRYLSTLSGGQMQRVGIAQMIVRETKILLLDEPTSALDPYNQIDTLQQLKQLVQSKNLLVMITLHDLNLAARFSDRVVILSDKTTATCGTIEEVVTKETIQQVYNINVDVIKHSSGRMVYVPV